MHKQLRSKAPSGHQGKDPNNAFTLIEVIIAIGVTAFALLGIFALFSATLKNNKDASGQQEGFEVERMLASKFQDTNEFPTNTMRTIFGQLYQTRITNSYYIYTSNNSGTLTTILTNTAPSSTTNYSGALYYIQLTAASNIPSALSNIFQNVSPGSLVNVTNWTNWPSVPVHATVYSIPTSTTTNSAYLSNTVPVISFDLIIPK